MTNHKSKVVGVLVAYNTPEALLLSTVTRLASQMFRLLVMDNSDSATREALIASINSLVGVEYHSSGGNVGIAEAQNRGIKRAIRLGADAVLFLDDDSTFPDDGVRTLLDELALECQALPNTAGIGPQIVDERTGQSLIAVWEGARVRPGTVIDRIEVAYLVSSGALILTEAFSKYGLFRSDYFIDHVDQEWGFRVGTQGGRLVITARVVMSHQLGDSPTTTRSGSVRYRHESPVRDYYLTRNAILMMRDVRLSPLRNLDRLRLLVESSVRKVLGRGRTIPQRRAVILGIVHGVVNRRGPM